jgi:hypothetical protein
MRPRAYRAISLERLEDRLLLRAGLSLGPAEDDDDADPPAQQAAAVTGPAAAVSGLFVGAVSVSPDGLPPHAAADLGGARQARLAREAALDEIFEQHAGLRAAMLVALAPGHGGHATAGLPGAPEPTPNVLAGFTPLDALLPRPDRPTTWLAPPFSHAGNASEEEGDPALEAPETPPKPEEAAPRNADVAPERAPAERAPIREPSQSGPLLPGRLPIDLEGLRDAAGSFFARIERLSPGGDDGPSLTALAAYLAVAGAAVEAVRQSTRRLAGRPAPRLPDFEELPSER